MEAVKDGVKIQQITPPVEVGIEYDLGTADCNTTVVALILQAMLDAGTDLGDINLADIEADPDFDDVLSSVTGIIEAGGDPTSSAAIEQAVEDFLNSPEPAPAPTPAPLSTDATISAGILATEALAGIFTGASNIAGSSALTVTVPDASKIDAALELTKGNTNSTIKYVKSASDPANDSAYTSTYTSGSTQITVADGDIIWLLVTAENGTTKLYYKITVTVAAPVITTTNPIIAIGESAPSVTVTGTNFKSGIGASDLTIGLGTTGLTLNSVSFVSATEITVVFAGTAAAGEVTIQAKTSAFDPVIVSASNILTIIVKELEVGDSYGGGIVAYIDGTGQHGLTAAETDQSTGIVWITGGIYDSATGKWSTQTTLNGNTSTDYGTGQANTNAMMAQIDYDGGAAEVCDDYSITVGSITYDDWFLPSKDELDLMYTNLYDQTPSIGGFVGSYYWSSSEYSAVSVYSHRFDINLKVSNLKPWAYHVRAVRAF